MLREMFYWYYSKTVKVKCTYLAFFCWFLLFFSKSIICSTDRQAELVNLSVVYCETTLSRFYSRCVVLIFSKLKIYVFKCAVCPSVVLNILSISFFLCLKSLFLISWFCRRLIIDNYFSHHEMNPVTSALNLYNFSSLIINPWSVLSKFH